MVKHIDPDQFREIKVVFYLQFNLLGVEVLFLIIMRERKVIG